MERGPTLGHQLPPDMFLYPSAELEQNCHSSHQKWPLQPWIPVCGPQCSSRGLFACLLPLCVLPAERALLWLAVPLRRPVLKDSLEDAP